MNKIILLFSLVLINLQIISQEAPAKKTKGGDFSRNSFYVDILGNSIPAALSYDHIWTKNGFLNISTSIGGMYLPINSFPTANGMFEVNFLLGKSKNMFEYSIGWTYAYMKFKPDTDDEQFYHLLNNTLRLGYRYQKPEGGFFFRAGIVVHMNKIMVTNDLIKTLVWNFVFKDYIQIALPGISLGFSF